MARTYDITPNGDGYRAKKRPGFIWWTILVTFLLAMLLQPNVWVKVLGVFATIWFAVGLTLKERASSRRKSS